MWNRTSPKQRAARVVTGGVVVAACVVVPFTLDGPGNPIVMAGHVKSVAMGVLDDEGRILAIDFEGMDPASLRTDGEASLSGTVVYAEGPDGAGIIIGSIVERDGGYAVALRQDVADQYRGKSELLYARPIFDVREAIELICAPGGAIAELEHARTVLLPVIQRELLTPLEVKLRAELELMLAELPEKHGDDIGALVEDLKKELNPELSQLTELLAQAAWDEVGVWGVAEGAGRKALNAGESAWDWTKETVGGLFGAEPPNPALKKRPRDFLTEERKTKIANAVLKEAKDFWVANQEVILTKAGKALKRHESTFMKKVEDDWLPRLYERVVKATWEGHGKVVEDALSDFGRDFARRRLTTKDNAPTLALAYAVRSATLITERPLFVLQKKLEVPVAEAEVKAAAAAPKPLTGDAAGGAENAEAAAPPPMEEPKLKLLPYVKHRRVGGG